MAKLLSVYCCVVGDDFHWEGCERVRPTAACDKAHKSISSSSFSNASERIVAATEFLVPGLAPVTVPDAASILSTLPIMLAGSPMSVDYPGFSVVPVIPAVAVSAASAGLASSVGALSRFPHLPLYPLISLILFLW